MMLLSVDLMIVQVWFEHGQQDENDKWKEYQDRLFTSHEQLRRPFVFFEEPSKTLNEQRGYYIMIVSKSISHCTNCFKRKKKMLKTD